jgi:hypothetical protein
MMLELLGYLARRPVEGLAVGVKQGNVAGEIAEPDDVGAGLAHGVVRVHRFASITEYCCGVAVGIVRIMLKPVVAKSALYSASVRTWPPKFTSMFTSRSFARCGALPGGIRDSTMSSVA